MSSLNVCGLKSKINLGVLKKFVEDMDFVCLSETKTNQLPKGEIPGFTYFAKENPDGKTRLGGTHGLGLLVNNELCKYIDIIDNQSTCSCPHVLWAKVNKEAFGEAFLLGSVHIPCESSIHYDCGWPDDLSSDLSLLISTYNLPFVLMGDFNARTGLLEEFVELEDVVANECGFTVNADVPLDLKEDLEELGIPSGRHNLDKRTNNNGRSLIEICQTFNLKIVNGRFGADREIGEFTCETTRGKSVIDYVIASTNFLPLVDDFEVDMYDRCLIVRYLFHFIRA